MANSEFKNSRKVLPNHKIFTPVQKRKEMAKNRYYVLYLFLILFIIDYIIDIVIDIFEMILIFNVIDFIFVIGFIYVVILFKLKSNIG